MTALMVVMGVMLLTALVTRILERAGRGQQAAMLDLALTVCVLALVGRWLAETVSGVVSVFHLF